MELTKNIKRQIRELAGLLYERELNAELAKLDKYFEQWRQGSSSPFDLAEHIHQFHQKPARELFNRFSHDSLFPSHVARAIADGSLSEAEVSPDVREALAVQIAFYKKEK